ncbi:MAG: cysteine--tRNA ligase, partial [Planctomycetota bacterium]
MLFAALRRFDSIAPALPLRLFNTLGRRLEEFVPLRSGEVRMYNCGPTVYQPPSIGNYRTFLFADLLRRTLEARGYRVLQVMNLTDVGHLTLEAEEGGEDKVQKAARERGVDPWTITAEIAALFFQDLGTLGVRPALHYPKATDHIPEMLEIVEGLLAKRHAYAVGENVYFDVTSFPGYGRLSGNRLEDLEAGARLERNPEKRHPADFALWKSDPAHVMKWPSRFGPNGFPGWHVECSAMSRKYLGDTLDIHTGGEDNIFPHHEGEIAQSVGFTGKPFVRHWLHTKFLLVDGGKMSKSLGNVILPEDVLARGHTGRQLRFALSRVHYRQPLNFTWDGMK